MQTEEKHAMNIVNESAMEESQKEEVVKTDGDDAKSTKSQQEDHAEKNEEEDEQTDRLDSSQDEPVNSKKRKREEEGEEKELSDQGKNQEAKEELDADAKQGSESPLRGKKRKTKNRSVSRDEEKGVTKEDAVKNALNLRKEAERINDQKRLYMKTIEDALPALATANMNQDRQKIDRILADLTAHAMKNPELSARSMAEIYKYLNDYQETDKWFAGSIDLGNMEDVPVWLESILSRPYVNQANFRRAEMYYRTYLTMPKNAYDEDLISSIIRSYSLGRDGLDPNEERAQEWTAILTKLEKTKAPKKADGMGAILTALLSRSSRSD